MEGLTTMTDGARMGAGGGVSGTGDWKRKGNALAPPPPTYPLPLVFDAAAAAATGGAGVEKRRSFRKCCRTSVRGYGCARKTGG